MDRAVKDRNLLEDFCIKFCNIVDKHARYIVVSGFLAIATGRTRGTEDIDMIIERLDKPRFIRLHDDLVRAGFACIQSDNPEIIYVDYLRDSSSVRYTYANQFLPEMEVKFAKDVIDDEQLQGRQKIPETGIDVWFSSVETNIAFKEEYLKSPKDLEDARHLRIVFSEKISESEIRRIKNTIKVLRP